MHKKMIWVLIVVVFAATWLTACSMSKETTADVNSSELAAVKADNKGDGKTYSYGDNDSNLARADVSFSKSAEVEKVQAGSTAIANAGTVVEPVSNAILAQRKIIRNANVTVEVEDFDKAYGKIKQLVASMGFIQETNIKKEKVYENDKEKLVTSGVIIIRIAKDEFEDTLSGIRGLGTILDEGIKTDDITDKFFDTESRLRLLKYEQTRLEEYLMKLTDPDQIFKTESRLTDIRHEIEGLTGTLNKWKDLIDLSTITINMYEKSAFKDAVKEKSYFEKLSTGFMDSFNGVLWFLSGLLLFLVSALPVLVLLGILVLILVLILRKLITYSQLKSKAEHVANTTDKMDNEDKNDPQDV